MAFGLSIISTCLLDLWLQLYLSASPQLVINSLLSLSFLASSCILHCNLLYAKLILAQVAGCAKKATDLIGEPEIQESSSEPALTICVPLTFSRLVD